MNHWSQLLLKKPFMSLKYPTLLQVAVLIASIGVGAVAIEPITAQPAPIDTSQLNPRPSIFNEPPYNRAIAPRPGRQKRKRPHKPRPAQPLGNRPDKRLGRPDAPNPKGRLRVPGRGERPRYRDRNRLRSLAPSGNRVPPARPQPIDNGLPGNPGDNPPLPPT